MALGLGELKLAPKNFWAMTAFEFLTAMGLSHHHAPPMTHAELKKMMKLHPDNQTRKEENHARK